VRCIIALSPLILASASPRRRELLAQLSVPFEVVPSSLPEPADRPADVKPAAWAEALAYFKARSVAEQYPGRWVLGADTVVACGETLLGKPRDRADARRMLSHQAGRVSDVITGVALLRSDAGKDERHIEHVLTRVWMRADPAVIEQYLATDDWTGKAGAYGIQTVGDRLVERIEGSFSNVVGLPTERLALLLRERGFDAELDVPDRGKS
jgi:septum formation protein